LKDFVLEVNFIDAAVDIPLPQKKGGRQSDACLFSCDAILSFIDDNGNKVSSLGCDLLIESFKSNPI